MTGVRLARAQERDKGRSQEGCRTREGACPKGESLGGGGGFADFAKINTSVTALSCVVFIVGFVAGDVYRYLSNKASNEVEYTGIPLIASTTKFSNAGLISAYGLPEFATEKVLASLFGLMS